MTDVRTGLDGICLSLDKNICGKWSATILASLILLIIFMFLKRRSYHEKVISY